MTNTLIQILRAGAVLAIAYTLFTIIKAMIRWKRLWPSDRKQWIYLVNELAFLGLAIGLLFIVQKRFQEPLSEIMKFKGQHLPAVRYRETKTGNLQNLDTGKLVLLNIWATWCGPCRKEMPELEKLSQDYPTAQIVALTDENPTTVHAFLRKHPYSLKTGSYESGDTWLDQIRSRPVSILLIDGKVEDVVIGARGYSFFRDWVKPHLK